MATPSLSRFSSPRSAFRSVQSIPQEEEWWLSPDNYQTVEDPMEDPNYYSNPLVWAGSPSSDMNVPVASFLDEPEPVMLPLQSTDEFTQAIVNGQLDLVKQYLQQDPQLVNQFLPNGKLPIHLLTRDRDLPMLALFLAAGVNLNPPTDSPLLTAREPRLFLEMLNQGAVPQTWEDSEKLYSHLYTYKNLPAIRYSSGRPVTARQLGVCEMVGNYLPVVRYEKILDEPAGSKFYFFEPESHEQIFLGKCLVAGSKYGALNHLVGLIPDQEAQLELNHFVERVAEAYPTWPIEDILLAFETILINLEDRGYVSTTVNAYYQDDDFHYLENLRGLDFQLNDCLVRLGLQAGYDTIILQRQPFKLVTTLILDLTGVPVCQATPRYFASNFIWYVEDEYNGVD